MKSNTRHMHLAFVLAAATFAVGAQAQTTNSEVQRDANQQTRIESGLQSGDLSTHEASQLERGEANIDRMQSNAEANGNLSTGEKDRIQAAQNRESAQINRDDNNAVKGNPSSASSQRMQADVQRNVNQDNRIEQGVQSGQLTNREAGSLERGQAHVDRSEARAGANGRVSAREQNNVQARENHQSNRIYRDKHNARTR